MSRRSEKVERKYAEALFELSAAPDREWRRDVLKNWLKILDNVPEMRQLVENPLFPEWERNKLLCDTMQQFCPGDQVMMDFIMEIAANRRLAGLKNIVAHYTALLQKSQGILAISVTSAFPLLEEERAELKLAMEHALSTELEITWQVDQDLIGGLVVKIGDTVIDNSLSGALERIKHDLLA